MYKRQAVKDWEYEAGWAIKQQQKGKKTYKGSTSIGIRWYYKTDRDIDAGIKVLLDLFEVMGIVENDRQFRRINYVEIFPDYDNPRVEVSLSEMV